MMNLCEYQEQARTTAIYPRSNTMLYPALGLVGECGEVAEKVKKLIRDDNHVLDDKRKEAIAKELGDCCWYLANICSDIKFSLGAICAEDEHEWKTYINQLPLPRVTLFLNYHASAIADILGKWYYKHDGDPRQSGQFPHLSNHFVAAVEYVKEIAERCGFTLEEICIANIDKLLDRKARGKIKGSGDER